MSAEVDTIRTGLEKGIRVGIRYAYSRAFGWGAVYYLSRGTIIVLSALTSAKALGAIDRLSNWQAYFALTVAILAAMETWLKPETRYRIFYEYDDEYRRLASALLVIPTGSPDELTKLAALRAELETVRSKFRRELFRAF